MSQDLIASAPGARQGVEGSNSLADLAARIRDAHRDVGILLTRSVLRAFDAGNLLIEAKAQVPHGQWLPWLRDHVEISERTAQRYTRLATHRAVIEANTTKLSDLRVSGALALLAAPRETGDGFIDDSVKLADTVVDSAFDLIGMTTKSEAAEFQLQRALVDEAAAAFDRIGEVVQGRWDEFDDIEPLAERV